ncbi:pyridoxamine 5'-phosphate oxidase family protein [Spirillospora sp. CA-108201]
MSTAHPEHGPHQVPLWFLWDGRAVWMCTGATSATARNVREEPRVRLARRAGTTRRSHHARRDAAGIAPVTRSPADAAPGGGDGMSEPGGRCSGCVLRSSCRWCSGCRRSLSASRSGT